jgi:hypothetical protein
MILFPYLRYFWISIIPFSGISSKTFSPFFRSFGLGNYLSLHKDHDSISKHSNILKDFSELG